MISPGLAEKPDWAGAAAGCLPFRNNENWLVSKNYCTAIVIKQNCHAKRAFPYLLRNSLSKTLILHILSNIIVKMPPTLGLLQCTNCFKYFIDFVIGQMLPMSRLHKGYIYTLENYTNICVGILLYQIFSFRSRNDVSPLYNLFSWL